MGMSHAISLDWLNWNIEPKIVCLCLSAFFVFCFVFGFWFLVFGFLAVVAGAEGDDAVALGLLCEQALVLRIEWAQGAHKAQVLQVVAAQLLAQVGNHLGIEDEPVRTSTWLARLVALSAPLQSSDLGAGREFIVAELHLALVEGRDAGL
jgi:hypothetical protein